MKVNKELINKIKSARTRGSSTAPDKILIIKVTKKLNSFNK